MKLKTKLSLWVVVSLLLVIGAMAVLTVASQRRLLVREMDEEHKNQARHLAQVCGESFFQNDISLFNYLQELKTSPFFVAAGFTNLSGKILMHVNPKWIGKNFSSPYEDRILRTGGSFKQGYRDADGINVADLAWPVEYGGQPAGFARLILSQDKINATLRRSMTDIVFRTLWVSLIALLLGILTALLAAVTLIRPLQAVILGVRNIAAGNLVRIPVLRRKDELAWLSNELNAAIDRLRELDEMKKEFTSNVTHELRSPLTAIQRFVALMLKQNYGPLTKDQREVLTTIENNTVRLTYLVDDLLTVSKIESRRLDIYLEWFDLRDVVHDVYSLYRSVAEEKNIRFGLRAQNESIYVWADRTKTNQILSNLVSNAFKFTEQGEVCIDIAEDNENVLVSVQDSGVGISEADRPFLFQKFFRSKATAHQVKGTGLGLSIVKAFLDAQGGTIQVGPSINGPGTRFEFKLPRKRPSDTDLNQI